MTDRQLTAIGRRLLRPYRIPPECPYLSEDQRELSTLDLKGRSEWMAEWLMLAASSRRYSPPVTPGGQCAQLKRRRQLPRRTGCQKSLSC